MDIQIFISFIIYLFTFLSPGQDVHLNRGQAFLLKDFSFLCLFHYLAGPTETPVKGKVSQQKADMSFAIYSAFHTRLMHLPHALEIAHYIVQIFGIR